MTLKYDPKDKPHACPYCDEEIAEAAFPYCEACGLKVLRCPSCQMPIRRNTEKCPTCGAEVREICKGE
jgi:predicted amidophosphoribosyltransferase